MKDTFFLVQVLLVIHQTDAKHQHGVQTYLFCMTTVQRERSARSRSCLPDNTYLFHLTGKDYLAHVAFVSGRERLLCSAWHTSPGLRVFLSHARSNPVQIYLALRLITAGRRWMELICILTLTKVFR